jgi:uncharacterized membrane protein YqiK
MEGSRDDRPLWSIAPVFLVALALLAVLFLFYRWVVRLFGIVIVPEDSVGIVNKKYVVLGQHRTLPAGTIIALNGEAGLQADALAPGLHFGLWPWQYIVTLQKFITISQDAIGIVEARDGHPLKNGRVLARLVDCNSFQDARAFLQNGGERGPQITVIPPGTYRVNTALFNVQAVKVLEVPDNMVGIVTTKEGRPLPAGEIASQPVPGHNSFQDAQAFVDAGGGKGLQEQVILAGRYFINPRFATVEIKETTIVPIANVGVVIAYVGREGVDVTGDNFKHGNLVNKGEKGVWVEPLDPGKYPINSYTHRVELVPTANVVLNWATGKTEAHNLDKNLSTITVRSSDGFTFNLDVSQIIHIPRSEAPKVIARFGSMVNLVTQVLEPTIGNYFRNAAQGSDVIDFLRTRRERQEDARKQISAALSDYNVVAVDTLIGDITPPESLMRTLTDRKLAEQEKVTYDTQRLAEETRKELQQATAMADTQASVVAAQRQVQIPEFQASAAVKTAEGQASSRKLVADGEAYATRATGNADAEKTRAVGTAEADVIKLKIASMDSGNYAGIEISKALAASGFKLVPDVVVAGGGGGDGGNSLVSVLLANLIRDNNKSKRAE